MGERPTTCQFKTHLLRWQKGLKSHSAKGKGGNREDERKEEKRERMKGKWPSMDGLSSEVRLNRTEVNNRCLVKGRSSQSGSNKKRKRGKKQPEVFLRGSCQTPFV